MTDSNNPLYRKKARTWGIGGLLGFSLLSVGQIVSLIGSGMTCFAQSVWVYTELGGSITNLTMLAVFAQLPGVLISPIAGVLVDRWDRRWVMIVSNAVSALATLALQILIVTHTYQIWHLYVITVVISFANHFQWPAFFATIPLVVPKKNLGSANGMVQLARSFGQVAAPVVAAVAVALFSIQGVIVFDMFSYLVAFATLLCVRIPRPPRAVLASAFKNSFMSELKYGYQYLFARPGLAGLLGLFSMSNFLLAGVSLLLLPMALNLVSITEYGGFMSINGIFMILSSVALIVWGVPRHRVLAILGLMVVQGVAIMLVGFYASVWVWVIAGALFYLAAPVTGAASEVIWQSKVEPEVQGRVMAACWMVSVAFAQLGYLVMGPLADNVFEPLMAVSGPLAGSVGLLMGTGPGRGIGLLFIVCGILYVGITVAAFFFRRLRNVETELPDEIDDISIRTSSPVGMVGTVLAGEYRGNLE